ncbi:hypothetical protein EXS62_00835 [Candidatus Kaiserbacteria bacterium]|nr:hypothetical protein [Candidatus Kaiserbacteria bacterium]
MSETKPLEISPSIAIIIAGVIIAAAIVFTNANPTTVQGVAAAGDVPAVETHVRAPSVDDHIIGSPSAPVVLIEYSDFQCPFCSRVDPTLKQIVSESNGNIAWVYRHLPLESIHPNAKPAAIASECIFEQLGNDGFWKFSDAIFADQSKMSDAYYAQLAVQFGADKTKFSTCVASGAASKRVDQDAAEAQQNGGNGTPFTIVYGKGKQVPISGALPYEQFMAVINAL